MMGLSDVVYEEEEGSKNRALGNPNDQLMYLDTSPPQAILKDWIYTLNLELKRGYI